MHAILQTTFRASGCQQKINLIRSAFIMSIKNNNRTFTSKADSTATNFLVISFTKVIKRFPM